MIKKGFLLASFAIGVFANIFAQDTLSFKKTRDKNIYVEKVWLNDRSLDRTYITFDELLNGGTLRFKMTDKVGL